jgi:hypothetical protein
MAIEEFKQGNIMVWPLPSNPAKLAYPEGLNVCGVGRDRQGLGGDTRERWDCDSEGL